MARSARFLHSGGELLVDLKAYYKIFQNMETYHGELSLRNSVEVDQKIRRNLVVAVLSRSQNDLLNSLLDDRSIDLENINSKKKKSIVKFLHRDRAGHKYILQRTFGND